MTPRRKKLVLWHFVAGERGGRVRVAERTPGGVLYVNYWDPEKRAQVYASLRHRDRERARRYAQEQADRIADGRAPTHGATVAQLLRLYVAHATPQKRSAKSRKEDERRATLWTSQIGTKLCADVTVADGNAVLAKRASGMIDAKGAHVRPADREKPGEQAVAHDGRFIRAVFYWGMRWPVEGGAFLIMRNPFGAPAPGVKSAFVLPRNRKPLRPVADDARFAAVRAAAELVTMDAHEGEAGAVLTTLGVKRHGPKKTESPNNRYRKPSYLPELLDLVWWTGRRRGAVAGLWYSDFLREGGEVKWIRFRPVKHAEEEEIVPIAAAARDAVRRILTQRPGVGDRPCSRRRVRPTDRSRSKRSTGGSSRRKRSPASATWGGLWHPYRRGWNTKRRHLPAKDRMRLGGWKSEKVMRESYEHPDDEGLLEVLEQPKTLRERSAQ